MFKINLFSDSNQFTVTDLLVLLGTSLVMHVLLVLEILGLPEITSINLIFLLLWNIHHVDNKIPRVPANGQCVFSILL